MTDMLTAKDMQNLLQVDRSTIYRMAEAGRLPAIKVGKQWRFPSDQVDQWFSRKTASTAPPPLPTDDPDPATDLADLLPLDCVQLIQDTFADLLGVMLVVTHL
ncbi:MAG: helix-turn-helix domain-containing protein, partial [Anaerolineae bacterium]|nr:helix-turn-helix domain-containing protein [Anaerolineae bacterium]